MPESGELGEEEVNVLIGDVGMEGGGEMLVCGMCVCVCGLCEHKSIFMLRGFMHTGACEGGL